MMLGTLRTLTLITLTLIVMGANCFLAAQESVQTPSQSLGQAGDEKLQRIICDFDLGNGDMRMRAFGDLKNAGGWFAIKALARALESESQNNQGYNHGIYASPRYYALQILPQIVPNSPLDSPNVLALDASSPYAVQRAAAWKGWLANNHDQLAQLEPRGEGIASSPDVCREAWQREIKAIKKINGSDRFSELQIILARDEQPEQLQQLACEVDYGGPDLQYATIMQLRSIGGWFSIRLLSRFLEEDSKLKHQSKNEALSYVLATLPWVVPDPPFAKLKNPQREDWFAEEIATWRDWLQQNHESLANLRPVGERIAVDEPTCRQVLKNDPASVALSRK